MKKKHLFFAIGLVLLLGYFPKTLAQIALQTTNLTIIYNNQQSDADFENVSKFYFENENLMIDQNGVIESIPLSTVRRLELEAVTTDIDDLTDWDANSVLIYPNPTRNRLFFSTSHNRQVLVTIYSMSGQLLKRSEVSTSESLDVSFLSKGIYVISVDDKMFKFSKL
ncbi:MAG: T9SS type A sorting domain-containing protein [Bacteroidales bacterium]|nr:T9SS type A sorting domain-containing protein [Bacteroidales bacterium]